MDGWPGAAGVPIHRPRIAREGGGCLAVPAMQGAHHMPITDWPAAERPREKLLSQGAGALSDAELLAIFLRTGVPGCSAVDLARQIPSSFGSLRTLLQAEQKQFCSRPGLGP